MYLPRKRTFWAVGIGHLTNDIFMSMGIVLLTFLSVSILPMTNTQIGFAISMKQIMGAISQPFFGARADSHGGRGIGAGGLLWVVVMFMLALIMAMVTRNYWLMLIPFILQGLGSGALHPVGALHAAETEPARSATNVSYFFLMGQTGLALGPALLGLMLDGTNLDALRVYTDLTHLAPLAQFNATLTPIFALALLAIPGVSLMATSIPIRIPKAKRQTTPTTQASHSDAHASDISDENPAPRITPAFPVIGALVLAVLVTLRGLAQPGSVNFIPVLFQQKGWSPAEYGLITSFFWIASGISGVVFGNLADRYDRRYIVLFSMVVSAPMFFFLPLVDGALAFLLAILAGGFSGGAHSIIVVLAQGLIPNSKGFASGAILGFIFGTGALGSLIIGSISDTIGLGTTFQMVAIAAALSGVLALFMPKRES
jgi:FSR family fosmidomycin resistance protein-like MFS transporter